MGAAKQLEPDQLDAHRFLRALGDCHTFLTFGEGNAKGQRGLTRTLHGRLAQHADTLARLNAQGAGVYVTVNATDGKGRKATNVTAVRALFADLDGAPLQPVTACELEPHIVVETSPQRWHAYWLADGVPLDQFKPLQQAIAKRFNSDAKVCDLARVMRLPGFLHSKRAPYPSHVVTLRDGPRYAHAELLQAFPIAIDAKQPRAVTGTLPDIITRTERNDTLFKLACGFVRKGIPAAGVTDRLQRINAERCQPPLCANEVDTIAASASAQGSRGFVMLPHSLVDSPEWKALPGASCAIVMEFYRRYNGSNNGRLAMPWSDVEGDHAISRGGTFYEHLRAAVNAGILIQVSEARNSQTGRIPAMYAIPDEYLAQVRKPHMGPSAKTAHLSK